MNARQILIRDLLVLFGLTGWAVALPGFASEFVTSMALTCLMYVALSSSWAMASGCPLAAAFSSHRRFWS